MTHPLLFKPGKLSQRAALSNINKEQLLACSNTAGSATVEIITLKEYYIEKVFEMVIGSAEHAGSEDEEITSEWLQKIDDQIKEVMDNGKVFVREFIEISSDLNVVVCLDVDEITDEVEQQAVTRLLLMGVMPAEAKFGKNKTFKSNELTF